MTYKKPKEGMGIAEALEHRKGISNGTRPIPEQVATELTRELMQDPDNLIPIGQTVNNGSLAITLNSSQFKPAPSPDYKVLILDVTVENIGQSEAHFNGSSYTYVTDKKRCTYESIYFHIEQEIGTGALQPGRKFMGQIAYKMPKEAVPVEFIYDDTVNIVIANKK